jgi:hypothetical protein
MRFLYALVFYLVFLAAIAAGVVLWIYELNELYDLAIKNIPDNAWLRPTVSVAAVAIGVCGLLFPFLFRQRRKSRTIEFQSKHGYIVIELDSVQKSLQKAMAKLPEVKDISLQVHPSDNDRKVRIVADAVVIKPPGAGIRETASDLEDKLAESAKRMLGVDDIASLDLNISRVLMNVKKEFDNVDKSRLLEHKQEQQPAQAAAPAAAAPAQAPAPAPSEPTQPESKPAEAPSDSAAPSGDAKPESEKSEEESSKGFWR